MSSKKNIERSPLLSSDSTKTLPAPSHQDGWDIKIVAFVIIAIITLLYVIFELGVAIYIDSLVLLSDGFHNLSDVVSLYIAYWAQKSRKKESNLIYSYGWARSEILGGLTNGCFLLSLCMYVGLESIPKFIEPQPLRGMENGSGNILFLVVAATGFGVNTIGTIVFLITGNSHGHSHSHGESKEKSHGHSHKEKKKKKSKELEMEEHGHGHGHKDKKKKKSSQRDMNVHAVFLHYLGDAVSSLLVLIAGLLIHFFDGKWALYIDPVSSLIIIIIILWTTVPLVKRCSIILLQSAPAEINLSELRTKIQKIEGVILIHDLHIWQLVDGLIISSVHVGVEEGIDFCIVITEVKKILHNHGIHSSCIQPEIVPRNYQDAKFCEQHCIADCTEEWCCKRDAERQKKLLEEFSISTELED